MCVQVVLNYALPDWTQPTLTCYCTSMLFASIHVVGLSILAFQQTSLMVVCVSCCNGGHIFDEGILNVNLASCMHCIRRKTLAENGINFERLCHHYVHCAFTCPPKLPLPLGDPCPLRIHGSLDQPESSSQTACKSGQPFLYSLPYSLRILYNGAGHIHQNCPFLHPSP